MTAFPDLLTAVSPGNPLAETIEFRTLVSEYESGQEVTKQKRLFPRRAFSLKYQFIEIAEARTLWLFFLGRKGKHLPFNLFLPFANTYTGEYIATTDGDATFYNLPSKSALDVVVYRSGAVLTGGGVDYTFTAEAGEDGADRIVLTAADPAGQYLTMDFTGRLKVRAKFAEDQMTFETFYNRLVTTGLKIAGLLNA